MKANIIAIFDAEGQRVLMCLRTKMPFQGLYNLVGGKVKTGEDDLSAAYRELFEETGISAKEVQLEHYMDFCYYDGRPFDELQVYFGQLKGEVSLVEELNHLAWIGLDENFFDLSRFAGAGSVGHVIAQLKNYGKNL